MAGAVWRLRAGDDRCGRPGIQAERSRMARRQAMAPLRRITAGEGLAAGGTNLDAFPDLQPKASSSPGKKCGNPAPVISLSILPPAAQRLTGALALKLRSQVQQPPTPPNLALTRTQA